MNPLRPDHFTQNTSGFGTVCGFSDKCWYFANLCNTDTFSWYYWSCSVNRGQHSEQTLSLRHIIMTDLQNVRCVLANATRTVSKNKIKIFSIVEYWSCETKVKKVSISKYLLWNTLQHTLNQSGFSGERRASNKVTSKFLN